MERFAYTSEFFAGHHADSIASARKIVPIAMELIKPRSIVDVGCGTGTWLAVFAEHGVIDYVGIDGDYVNRSQLVIPLERFLGWDLNDAVPVDRRFDLAISLEVAEHLPASSAATFVQSLTKLAPVVLFSAAVPGQGGVQHINEQWPSYWVSRFAEHDFEAVDAVRPRVWNDNDVAWWYAQNTLLFVSSMALESRTLLRTERDCPPSAMDLVHPRMYEDALAASQQLTARQLLRMLPRALHRSIAWRAGRLR